MLHCNRYDWTELTSSDAALDRYNAVFTKAGDPRNMNVLRWRYIDGPTKFSCVLLAVDMERGKDQGVGICALFGVPFRLHGHSVTAAQAIDSLTDDDHRGKGLFVWLAEQAYSEFHRKGGSIIWGFPNPNLRNAYPKYLKWEMLNPMPYLIKPLRSGYFIDTILRHIGMKSSPSFLNFSLSFRSPTIHSDGLQIHRIRRFDEDHNQLWKSFSRGIETCVERDSNYMNWRIFDCPYGSKYKVLGASRDGTLVAEIIWCVEEKHGGSIGYVMDWLCVPGEERAARKIMALALGDMKSQKADAALAWNARHSPNSGIYTRAGFLPFPEKLRPSNLYWGARILQPIANENTTRRQHWYISYTDSDTT